MSKSSCTACLHWACLREDIFHPSLLPAQGTGEFPTSPGDFPFGNNSFTSAILPLKYRRSPPLQFVVPLVWLPVSPCSPSWCLHPWHFGRTPILSALTRCRLSRGRTSYARTTTRDLRATRPLAAVAAKTSRLFARSYDKWPDFITQSCD